MDKLKAFEPIFHPNSMAVVGASAEEGKPGNQFLRALIEFGFKGKLYPVNPDSNEILGFKVYPTVRDIPETVDFVYISTPASSVPKVIEDCIAKGVPALAIFTAGFSEAGEDGRKLEQEIAMLAKGKLRIIGPNCFGVYCPRGGLTLLPGAKYPKESGNVALISQSGGIATHFIWAASGYGLRFSKVISYGNACDLNESDFLEYLTADPETRIVAAYLEGVKDGRRFFKLAKSLSREKPLIVWKGGLTEIGKRAVNSHTGSLGGEKTAWEAFSRQTGTVLVDSFEEFLDTTTLFPHFSEGIGRRVAVVGGGGAVGVAASDACEQVGLQIPIAPTEIQERLKTLFPSVGTSFRNPFDVGAPTLPPSLFEKTLEILLSWGGIDTLITDRIYFYGTPQLTGMPGTDSERRAQVLLDIKRRFKKPLLAVLGELATDPNKIDMEIDRRRIQDQFLQSGIAVMPSLQRAAIALANVCSYHEKVPTG